MVDWRQQLEAFLAFFDRHPPQYEGDPVSAFVAQQHAETEFEKYKIVQDRLFLNDYDRYLLALDEEVKRQQNKGKND